MYNNKLVVAIKHNDKILREIKDLVLLPYGAEFSVLVKNLSSKRVMFTLHIDGTDVLDGTRIIVNSNAESEIKRFIRNGNMNEGNAFKFIERTQEIENGPRGIKVDDGIVRVEYWFEKDFTPTYYDTIYTKSTWGASGSIVNSSTKGVLRGASGSIGDIQCSTISGAVATSASLNDVGITVPGSKVEQKFSTVYGFQAEQKSDVIILRMAGAVGDVEVTQPITVKHKPKCSTCGRTNKATSNFCTGCGSALVLI